MKKSCLMIHDEFVVQRSGLRLGSSPIQKVWMHALMVLQTLVLCFAFAIAALVLVICFKHLKRACVRKKTSST